jgi:hypothetical protein
MAVNQTLCYKQEDGKYMFLKFGNVKIPLLILVK